MIHATAIISDKARIDKSAEIGPYAIVNDNAVIGAGTKVGAFCVVNGNVTIGKNCEIFTGAIIGSRPQDLKYKGAKSFLDIGDNNVIREYCTLNPGTGENTRTIIGNNNLFMAYAHVAHDCTIGNHCIMANCGTLAGHVTLEDYAIISGLVAVHQFVRVGKLAIVGGCSKVVQDVPPFSTSDGHPARVYGLNLVGLKRKNISLESVNNLKKAYRILFNSGLSPKSATSRVEQEVKADAQVDYLVSFIKNSPRGVIRSCRS